jgi:hypothetical protein
LFSLQVKKGRSGFTRNGLLSLRTCQLGQVKRCGCCMPERFGKT